MLDRADCADFGCHNSIRLETKHFLNTLALTFISFSGRFVFAMQKHYLFFCERSSSLYIIFVNIHLPLKQKCHICLHFGKLLGKFGRSLPENIYDPIFQYRSIHKAKILFDIDIIIRYQHYIGDITTGNLRAEETRTY